MERPFQVLDQYLELSQRFDERVARNIRQYPAAATPPCASRAALRAPGKPRQRPCRSYRRTSPDLAPSLAELPRQAPATPNRRRRARRRPAQGLLLLQAGAISPTWNSWSAYPWTPRRGGPRPAPTAPRCCRQPAPDRLGLARAKLVKRPAALAGDVERGLAGPARRAGPRGGSRPCRARRARRATQASDDFAAMMGLAGDAEAGSSAEDRGVMLRRELASLLQRYPDELRRTRDLSSVASNCPADTGAPELDAVRQALATWNRRCAANASACKPGTPDPGWDDRPLILLIALSAIDSLQRRLARVLGAAVPALSAWAGGDFSRPHIPAYPHTEDLRNLEGSLNRLRSFPRRAGRRDPPPRRTRSPEQPDPGRGQRRRPARRGRAPGRRYRADPRRPRRRMEAAIQRVAGDASQDRRRRSQRLARQWSMASG
ncbi:hypothetical protein ACPA9J_04415 [Pseudomonas aeruginosa]